MSGQGVGGHGDLIPAGQAVVVAVPVDRAAHRRGPTITQSWRRRPPGGSCWRHTRSGVESRQLVAQLSEHSAARLTGASW